jgi:predicted nucleotidyltransferase
MFWKICTYIVPAICLLYFIVLFRGEAMEKSARINLRIDPDTKKKCEALAQEEGVTLSAVIGVYLKTLARESQIPSIALAKARYIPKKNLLSFGDIYTLVNGVVSSYGPKIQKVFLFGSYARDEARPSSDVNLLIEPGPKMSLFDLGRLQSELEEKLGRKVDLVSSLETLPKAMVASIEHDRKILYLFSSPKKN